MTVLELAETTNAPELDTLRKEELEGKHHGALSAHSIDMAANELAALKKMSDKTPSSLKSSAPTSGVSRRGTFCSGIV
jgi:hypothetical protein